MPGLTKAEEFAIAAVARHFSAPWQRGEGPPDAYLTVDGRRVALEVAVLAQQTLRRKPAPRARLREDKVAQRVLRAIESALRARVPDGAAIILTLGAPIKVPNRLVAALANTLLNYLASGAQGVEEKKTILGNRVRFRVVNDGSNWKVKVIGFVFSGDPEPGALADAMRSFHPAVTAKANRHLPDGFAGHRWLVLASDHWIADIKTYRRAWSLVGPAHNFRKILMVFDGRRVETLAEIFRATV